MSYNPAADLSAHLPGRWQRLVLAIVWPAFVMAGVLEALVFALVDPAVLNALDASGPLSPGAIHTLAFLVFWGVIAVSSAVTQWLGVDDPAPAPAAPPGQ